MHSSAPGFAGEIAYAVDTSNPNRILGMARKQRPVYPDEDFDALRAITGAPASAYPWVYKNGQLLESADGGRSFREVEGGLTGWYEHRTGIFRTETGVIGVLYTGSTGTASDGRLLMSISADDGISWFNGGPSGRTGMNDPAVTRFVLADGSEPVNGLYYFAASISSTIVFDDTHFLTVFAPSVNATGTPVPGVENIELRGIYWHIDGLLVPGVVSISGKVMLEGRSPTETFALVTFEIRQPGTTTIAVNTLEDMVPDMPGTQIVTAADGSYNLLRVPEGTYDLTAKTNGHLQAKISNVVVRRWRETPDQNFLLPGGDFDDFNAVSIPDLNILKRNYGKTGER
jgi:hypothetical protein